MKTENILKTDLLDILFEKRNKQYGAYPLRKYYNKRLLKALAGALLIVCITSLCILKYKPSILLKHEIVDTRIISLPVVELDKPKEPEKPKIPIKPRIPDAAPAAKTADFISNIAIVNNEIKTSKISNIDSAVISNITSTGPYSAKPVTSPVEHPVLSGDSGIKHIDKNIPLKIAEVMPSFPGGEAALIKFLQRNLENPKDLEGDEAVTVKIGFIVGYDGKLKRFETLQDGGEDFNNQVIRVLKKMPDWVPGKTAGENVSVYFSIPVKFVRQE